MPTCRCVIKFVTDKYSVQVAADGRQEAELSALRKFGNFLSSNPHHMLDNAHIVVVCRELK